MSMDRHRRDPLASTASGAMPGSRPSTRRSTGSGSSRTAPSRARDGRIAFVGPESELPSASGEMHRLRRPLDHAGPDRLPHPSRPCRRPRAEFEMRLAGATYEEIAAAGGGIVSTVEATRAASEDELVASALPRLDRSHRRGRDDGRDQVRLRARPRDRAAHAARRARLGEDAAGRRRHDLPRRARRCRRSMARRRTMSTSSARR